MDTLYEIFNNFVGFPVIILSVILVSVVGLIFYIKDERERKIAQDYFRVGWSNSPWPKVSGGILEDYFDLDKYVENPNNKASEIYIELINKAINEFGDFDLLAFIEREAGPIGAIQLKDSLTVKTGIPGIIVRPKRRLYKSAVKGTGIKAGMKVLLVSDVATMGTSLARSKRMLDRFGLIVPAAVVFLSREKEEVQKMKLGDLKLIFYTNIDGLRNIIKKRAA